MNKVNCILYINSNNARDNILNPNIQAQSRYIDIKYKQFIQEVDRKVFEIEYLLGDEILANGLIKPLKANKYAKFIKLLNMVQKKVPWV